MKVITWNVNNRVGVVSQQVQVLGQREPDVVSLQDVNVNAVSRYIEAFHVIGLPHVLHTLERQHKAQYISLKGLLALYSRGKSHQCELTYLPCLTRKLS